MRSLDLHCGELQGLGVVTCQVKWKRYVVEGGGDDKDPFSGCKQGVEYYYYI